MDDLLKEGFSAFQQMQGVGQGQGGNQGDDQNSAPPPRRRPQQDDDQGGYDDQRAPPVHQVDEDAAISQVNPAHANNARTAISHAQQHASTPISDEEEDQVAQAHKTASTGPPQTLDSLEGLVGGIGGANGIGGAAAAKALQSMMGGGGGGGGGAFDSNKLIGMAMSQAETMFNASAGASGGGSESLKQKAMNGAAEYAMKMVVKQKLSAFGVGGGDDSGGASSMVTGLLGKFM